MSRYLTLTQCCPKQSAKLWHFLFVFALFGAPLNLWATSCEYLASGLLERAIFVDFETLNAKSEAQLREDLKAYHALKIKLEADFAELQKIPVWSNLPPEHQTAHFTERERME